MAATKIILKRSSIPGKSPNTSNLAPGELAVNTNANEPGLFFEVTDGQVVKVGPTAYLPEEPIVTPARGELWLDADTHSLNIGNNLNEWEKVAAPFLGGTAALTVFVAPDFPAATDSLANDGQSIPFVTINRAILEVSKKIISDANNGLSSGNSRYLIVLAPSRHCVVNGPGSLVPDFTVNFNNNYTDVTQSSLQAFNGADGGLILPRGVSIIGMDLKKCEIHPVYVPTYTHPAFPANFQQTSGGPVYTNQPLSSIFKWSGNTYVSNFTNLDKIESRTVTSVSVDDTTDAAIFKTARPHGLNLNDFVRVDFTNDADQSGSTFAEGAYFAYPVNAYEFELSATSWAVSTTNPVLASTMPAAFLTPVDNGRAKFEVNNIYPYYVPTDGTSYELSNYSHHRLSVFKNCSVNELNEFYQKVQIAFSNYFGGAVNKYVASVPEYQIVADAENLYPNNVDANSVDFSSPYLNQVNHRSNYGMANVDADGELVTGFKSVIVNSATAVILQKDPAAYEIYADTEQIWWTLTATGQSRLPVGTPITEVPTGLQLAILNEAAIPNIRYYYTTLLTDTGKSTGITDINNDFRHFGFRIRGSGAYMQAQSVYTIGAAIGSWAMNGAIMNLTGSTSNFGSTSFQAEGFAGNGTLGGSTQVNQGFLQSGIVRPLALTEPQVTSDSQKRILSLGSRVVHIGDDPEDNNVTLIYLRQAFDPASILPFSLKPGSAVFLGDPVCTYSAFFVDDGTPTCILSESDTLKNPYAPGGAILRVRKSSSNLPSTGVSDNSFPYIRRFIDPRTDTERCYGLYVESTNPSSQAPQTGAILRLNQVGKDLSTTIKRNYQFDPGKFGGIAQTFVVYATETVQYNFSLNFNNKVSDNSQSTAYAVYTGLGDNAGPWIQSYLDGTTQVPYYSAEGTYTTNFYRNYYAAENNLWSALYYKTTFNPENGPTKVAPNRSDSPYVTSAVLTRQENIVDAWQGYVPDPYYAYYTEDLPGELSATMTYMRGAITPDKAYAAQYVYDNDNGSPSMGIIYHRLPIDSAASLLTSPSVVVQSGIPMSSPVVGTPTFGRPEIIQFTALQVSQIENPKNGLSVIQLSNSTLGAVEYLRVIGSASNVITAQRNYYPEYAVGTLPATWPVGTEIKPCVSTGYPEPATYDPDWTITKSTIFRYYQLMGFAPNLLAPYLIPQYAGERVLYNNSLPISPINGYANKAASWPVEFNIPSTIFANNHTWTYVGYFDYSRGLPKYQTNELSRKLTADYQAFESWGGRVTCFGAGEKGNLVLSGDFRDAFTLNYFTNNTPLQNANDRVVYASPQPIDYPSPILVYSTDDITSEFDGVRVTFDLKRGGYAIPRSQLSTPGVFVFLGGVAQLPGAAYNVVDSQITFTEAPIAGTACDIRVITSDDAGKTVDVVSFAVGGTFDSATSSFPLNPDTPGLTNGNSLVFLGGVLQDPLGPPTQIDFAYTISYSGDIPQLTFIGAAPDKGTSVNVRGILSGTPYRTAGVPIVFMSSTDEISDMFDGGRTSFPLTIDGVPIDTYKVNAENMFVNLGGVMQIPIANAGSATLGLAYTVEVNPITQTTEITFAVPPAFGTTCNIRIIHQDEFITCPLPDILLNQYLKSGPGVETTADGELIGIDEGLIS